MFKLKEIFPQFEFNDFDKDGCKDIRIHYNSNTPSIQDLILFDRKNLTFKQIENFNSFPASEKINGTKYYYSYHRSGCADLNWDSDLFYIKNFKIVLIGNISGIGCGNRDDEVDGIYIKKIKGSKEILLKTLSINIIDNYKDYKWGFIKEYWTKNFQKFDN